MKMVTVSENFLKKDIKSQIKMGLRSVEYIEGYMFACYLLDAITKDTLTELRNYLKEKEEKVNDKN